MKAQAIVLLVFLTAASAQVNHGDLRLKIMDPTGAPVSAVVKLVSAGNDFDESFSSDASGAVTIRRLPFGSYTLQVERPEFALFSELIEIQSTLPVERQIRLQMASVHTDVQVTGADTLIDPFSPSSTMQIGTGQVEQRLSSLPGRSVQDLVISQPGWLYEGNAVLHPRGSEYQTQFVVDGIPMTDNRSPSFGPEIEADDLDSMSIYTAGFPAEYGRKLGGVVELDTRRETRQGLHGEFVLSGGSYDTASSYGEVQQVRGKSTIGATASGGMTSHYLNPVVPENYTNRATTGDFSTRYERELPGSDRLILGVRHEFARFLVPDERVQEQAGQVQNGDNFETIGNTTYQHIASQNSLIVLAGMLRDHSSDLYSNRNPTPIAAFQHNSFREGYFKGTYSLHHGQQEFKAGFDSDNTFLHEQFNYAITDFSRFSSDTPPRLNFTAQRPDLEQSAFVEDTIHLDKWTISMGLRWDHYQLLLNRNAFSPRLSVGRYLPSARMVVHASYDRIFQTPYFENILISGSPQIDALSSQFLRLPVQPSQGNYFESGVTESVFERMRLDMNVYRREIHNFADDDQLLNTGISYPIAFKRAVIYGGEGKLEVVHLQKLTGFASYSYMVGNVWFPVTGGLFLGDDVSSALSQISGHVPVSQDQRNTLWTRFRYGITPHLWFAAGTSYGSGLPFEYTGSEAEALAQYGPEVIGRVNFERGRVRPQLSTDTSFGVTLCECGHVRMNLQADGENLNNRLNLIDFNGLFSGNAIGPARTFSLRWQTSF